MKYLLISLLAFCLFKTTYAQQYIINAHITGIPDGCKFYLSDISIGSDIDSAVIRNSTFIMKGKLAEAPKLLRLHTLYNKDQYVAHLLICNEAVVIKGDVKDFPTNLLITGSKTQVDYSQLQKLSAVHDKKRNELVEQFFALSGDSVKIKGRKIWEVINKADSADLLVRTNYVKTHLNSHAGLYELFNIKNKFRNDTLRLMYNSLKPEFKQSLFGQRIGNYLKVGDILKKGDAMADFEALDKNGVKHRLLNFKGKYILLDFSTTYCGPCLLSLEDLRNIEKRYADKLTIITFSGDVGKDTWLKGLNRDNPKWLSVWDGKGNYGETILKYGISCYPTFVLIDPQGKIAAKWEGYGKEPGRKGSLETSVDKILGNL
ncbi:TlpA disulfide reductase family protein [Mucilaginibacter sp. PAMB04168]|uniref:TlpA disulfide reductase family protein n=1 Tax=Mucilaginibacter sp. PAMB04168 TaxID=3138567 RepID=UPI0031F67091